MKTDECTEYFIRPVHINNVDQDKSYWIEIMTIKTL